MAVLINDQIIYVPWIEIKVNRVNYHIFFFFFWDRRDIRYAWQCSSYHFFFFFMECIFPDKEYLANHALYELSVPSNPRILDLSDLGNKIHNFFFFFFYSPDVLYRGSSNSTKVGFQETKIPWMLYCSIDQAKD